MGFYFVAYVAYLSTKYIIREYKAEYLIFYTLAFVGLLDAVVTLGQYSFMPFAAFVLC